MVRKHINRVIQELLIRYLLNFPMGFGPPNIAKKVILMCEAQGSPERCTGTPVPRSDKRGQLKMIFNAFAVGDVGCRLV
jgi:hypothetical protein